MALLLVILIASPIAASAAWSNYEGPDNNRVTVKDYEESTTFTQKILKSFGQLTARLFKVDEQDTDKIRIIGLPVGKGLMPWYNGHKPIPELIPRPIDQTDQEIPIIDAGPYPLDDEEKLIDWIPKIVPPPEQSTYNDVVFRDIQATADVEVMEDYTTIAYNTYNRGDLEMTFDVRTILAEYNEQTREWEIINEDHFTQTLAPGMGIGSIGPHYLESGYYVTMIQIIFPIGSHGDDNLINDFDHEVFTVR